MQPAHRTRPKLNCLGRQARTSFSQRTIVPCRRALRPQHPARAAMLASILAAVLREHPPEQRAGE
eukprot:5983951-Alexandrium_andersonii.AAC.1